MLICKIWVFHESWYTSLDYHPSLRSKWRGYLHSDTDSFSFQAFPSSRSYPPPRNALLDFLMPLWKTFHPFADSSDITSCGDRKYTPPRCLTASGKWSIILESTVTAISVSISPTRLYYIPFARILYSILIARFEIVTSISRWFLGRNGCFTMHDSSNFLRSLLCGSSSVELWNG